MVYGTGEQAGSESETPARWFCWFDNYSNAVNGGSASFAEECVCVRHLHMLDRGTSERDSE